MGLLGNTRWNSSTNSRNPRGRTRHRAELKPHDARQRGTMGAMALRDLGPSLLGLYQQWPRR
eukprot:442800-Lingulodinium_polyedra.AAC.1